MANQVMNEKRLPKMRIKMISTINKTILIADSAIANAKLVKLDGSAETPNTVYKPLTNSVAVSLTDVTGT